MKSTKENKMGIMSVNRLLFSMSIPMMLSMLVQSLYNVIDSMFVAQINENALTALSLVFPVQQLMIGIGVGTGIGVNALLARSLGEKNYKKVNLSAANGIFLAIITSILFAIFGLLFGVLFVHSQTKDPEIAGYAINYLSIITIFSFGLFIALLFERLLQATGKTVYSMICQIVGAVTNIVLDPILIFGLFGFPKLGVTGAAIATVIGQFLSAALGIYFNFKKNHEIQIHFKGFKPNLNIIKSIYFIGLPSIVMQSIGSFLTYAMNKLLISFTPTAVSVFGIYFKLQSFIFMPVFGLNNGMMPIISFNYGARNKRRITDTIKLSIITAVGIMLVGLLIFQTIPGQLLALFDASEQMIAIGVPALRIISLSFAFAGFSIIAGSVFQALGNGMLSLIISITRQLVFILPLAYIFGHTFGLNSIWFSIPIAEISSLVLSIIFLRRMLRKKVYNL
jgi:MATE family, multidrug efflux pump